MEINSKATLNQVSEASFEKLYNELITYYADDDSIYIRKSASVSHTDKQFVIDIVAADRLQDDDCGLSICLTNMGEEGEHMKSAVEILKANGPILYAKEFQVKFINDAYDLIPIYEIATCMDEILPLCTALFNRDYVTRLAASA